MSLRLLLLLLLLTGCSQASQDAPVADSTLVDVLVELHLLEGRRYVLGDSARVPSADSIYARYEVTEGAVEDRLADLRTRPDSFETLYGNVLDRLARERSELTAPDTAAPSR